MTKRRILIVAGILFTMGATGGSEQGTNRRAPKTLVMTIPAFATTPNEESDKAVDDLVRAQIAIGTALMNQLRQADQPNQARVFTIYLLGVFRVVEAVEPLAEIIDFKAENPEMARRLARWSHYPARDALQKIGPASVPVMLERLSTEDNQVRRALMCSVLRQVEGVEVAMFLVSRSVGAEPNAQRKARMEQALRVLEHPGSAP